MAKDPYSTVLEAYGWLADLYMIDYFIENHWKMLPESWRDYFNLLIALAGKDKAKIRDLIKFILGSSRDPQVEPNLFESSIRRIPMPLSFVCMKQCVQRLSTISFSRIQIPSNFTSLHEILPSSLRIKIKEKKSHEISRLYDFIRLLVNNLNSTIEINEIVDIGAGLGHLSRILSLLFNFQVTTIEGNEQLVQRSNKIDSTTEISYVHKIKNDEIKDLINISSSYKRPERKAAFLQHENEISTTGSHQMIVGLHTCGDLSSIILRHFILNHNANALINLGCCYHKLNGGLDKLYRDEYEGVNSPINHHGFPLSKKFKEFKLSYAARELACFGKEQFLKRLDNSIKDEVLFVNCYRAILEWIILGCPNADSANFDPVFRHQGLRGVRDAGKLTFWDYANETLKEKPELKKHFYTICDSRPELKSKVQQIIDNESTQVLLLYTLRLMIAPLIETIILKDRQEFLLENDCPVFLIPIFDSNISPRNIAIVAWKSLSS